MTQTDREMEQQEDERYWDPSLGSPMALALFQGPWRADNLSWQFDKFYSISLTDLIVRVDYG